MFRRVTKDVRYHSPYQNSFTFPTQTEILMNPLKSLLSGCVVLFLSACGGGGGGGGGTSPPPAPVVSITFVSASVSPAVNAVGVSPQATLSAEFNVVNADTSTPSATVSLTCSGSTQISFSTTMTAVTLPQGSVGKQWKASAVPTAPYPLGLPCSGQMRVTVGGVTEAQSFAFTTSSVFAYTDKVYTLYVGGYPYAVTKTGVTKVKNMTQYTSPGFGLFDCDLYEEAVENGIVPVRCAANVDLVRRVFQINPITEELSLYTGTFVFDNTKWHSFAWGTAMPYGNSVGPSGGYAEVADGIYWGPWSSGQTLKFSPKVGTGYDFNNVLVVTQASGPDVFKLVMKYSH
ncbi:MAG: hypothetical protein QG653_336 [Patescibacteria group bacterium]|nr:hypothetical protein [Patescibacteria group bacterium]